MKQTKFTPEGKKVHPSTNSSEKYKIICTDNFLREARVLAKNYPNIKEDFLVLKDILKKQPEQGESLGAGIYKIEMLISDKKRGKSECARVIIQVKVTDKIVYVLHTYDKAEFDTVVTKTIKDQIKKGAYYQE